MGFHLTAKWQSLSVHIQVSDLHSLAVGLSSGRNDLNGGKGVTIGQCLDFVRAVFLTGVVVVSSLLGYLLSHYSMDAF